MHRTRFDEMHCSIAQTLELVGEWWTPLILRDVYLGLHRFDDLARNLEISRNLLTGRLEGLVANEILERRLYQERPARHEYHLTPAGMALVPALMALMAWGDTYATPPAGQPVRLVHDRCGQAFTPEVACSECGERVYATEVTAYAGPGARSGPGTTVLAERAGLKGEIRPEPDAAAPARGRR